MKLLPLSSDMPSCDSAPTSFSIAHNHTVADNMGYDTSLKK